MLINDRCDVITVTSMLTLLQAVLNLHLHICIDVCVSVMLFDVDLPQFITIVMPYD